MVGSLRFFTKVTLLLAVTFGFYAIRLAFLPFTFAFPKFDRRVRQIVFRSWARIAARIYGMRIRVEGPRPKPPFFLVTNHLTYLDGLTIASQIDAVFVAKSEVSSWPLVGFFAKQVNVIFIDRQKRSDTVRVNGIIEDTIKNGEGVMMFAESTTSKGDMVLPFKTALFDAAAQNNYPVYGAAIYYEALPGSPPATEWITWWTDISFGAHISKVLREKGLNAVLTFAEGPITGTDRKLLAQSAHETVMSVFRPME
jgi:1-acyl-sn-glycerol-3-phosphate acyltransferase